MIRSCGCRRCRCWSGIRCRCHVRIRIRIRWWWRRIVLRRTWIVRLWRNNFIDRQLLFANMINKKNYKTSELKHRTWVPTHNREASQASNWSWLATKHKRKFEFEYQTDLVLCCNQHKDHAIVVQHPSPTVWNQENFKLLFFRNKNTFITSSKVVDANTVEWTRQRIVEPNRSWID